MNNFKYDKGILKELEKDSILQPLIRKYGYLSREVFNNPLQALVEQIISQQINTKTATKIALNVKKLTNDYDLDTIQKISVEQLKACGLSMKKAYNIKNIFKKVSNNELDFNNFNKMSNQEIIDELIKLEGIGVWSAEMFLIFYLQRLDIISYGDYGIRKALEQLYNIEKLRKKDFTVLISNYQHYGSIVSFYLWKYFSEEKMK